MLQNTSEVINFTAAGTTLPFVATYEGVFPRILTLSRSIIEDETGSMTDRRMQEAF